MENSIEIEYLNQTIKSCEDRIDILNRCDCVEFRAGQAPNEYILIMTKADISVALFVEKLIASYKLEVIDAKMKLLKLKAQ